MTLEDRLRSHMHSGEDLFVEGHNSAEDISALGHRRTRRNQVGGAVAGGVLAFALVAGAVSLGGNDTTDADLATGEITEELAEAEMAQDDATIAAAEDFADEGSADGLDEANESSALDEFEEDEAADGQFFEGPIPPFETVVGVGDGFAGLRDTDGVITAIESDNGTVWRERPTTGVVEGAMFITLVHDDGVFASIFSRFDDGGQETWIGTSPDLDTWTLVPVDSADDLDIGLTGIDVVDGEVVAPAVAFNSRAETEDELTAEVGLYVGPAGGPFELLSLPTDAPGSIVSSGGSLIVGDRNGLLRSSDRGQTWTPVEGIGDDDFWTVAAIDEVAVSLNIDNAIRESVDGGATWSEGALPVDIDANASVVVVGGVDSIGVFVSSFDNSGENRGVMLFVRDIDGWRLVDVPEPVRPGFRQPVALSEDELIIQIFDDGPVGLPLYLRVPTR